MFVFSIWITSGGLVWTGAAISLVPLTVATGGLKFTGSAQPLS